MTATNLADVFRELFHATCPRCGHRSVYDHEGEERCAWPWCAWPAAVRKHYRLTGVDDEGKVTLIVTEG